LNVGDIKLSDIYSVLEVRNLKIPSRYPGEASKGKTLGGKAEKDFWKVMSYYGYIRPPG
jgi:hypothetical protein